MFNNPTTERWRVDVTLFLVFNVCVCGLRKLMRLTLEVHVLDRVARARFERQSVACLSEQCNNTKKCFHINLVHYSVLAYSVYSRLWPT